MLDASAWDRVGDRVGEADFYRKEHRLAFSAVASLIDDARPCDVVTVSEWLSSRSLLDDAGGLAFMIGELLEAGLLHEDVRTVAGPGLRRYAEEVRPPLEAGTLRTDELEVCLVHEGGGAECLPGLLAS